MDKRCTFYLVMIHLMMMVACSAVTSSTSSRSQGTESDAPPASQDANQQQSTASSPAEITGTNLVLAADNFVSGSISGAGASRVLIPKITGGRSPDGVRAWTKIVIKAPGDSRVFAIVETGVQNEHKWGKPIRMPLPADFPQTATAQVTVKDMKSGLETTRDVAAAPTAPSGGTSVHRVFATNAVFQGNFARGVAGLGVDPTPAALVRGDQKCQAEATAAGLAGKFKVVLSVPAVAARDRFAFSGPVKQVGDERQFAANSEEFFSQESRFTQMIDRNTQGQLISGQLGFWTGSDANFLSGLGGQDHCNAWTDTSYMGRSSYFGEEQGGPGGFMTYYWYHGTVTSCTDYNHLLCLEE